MSNQLDYDKIEKTAKLRQRVKNVVIYGLLVFWAVVVLFPFYWMLLTSVKSYSSYNSEYIPKFFTLSPTLQNYVDAFTTVPLAGYLLNTLIFTLVTTAIMLVVTVLAAFAFARLDFKGKDLTFTLFLSLMMIPSELVVITNFVTITNMDMRNTFMGLILPSVTSVFYIYLLKENFAQIPDQLYYAAKVEMNERDIYKSELNAKNPYNTRGPNMGGKIPIGPICNPSKTAIEAALDYTETDAYYFVADKNGKVYFTKNNDEHIKMINKLKNEGLWYTYD